MKALFQFLIIASMSSIFLDITSCTRQYAHSDPFRFQGQFVDINTRQPVKHVELRMQATNGTNQISTIADESGHFEVTLPSHENPHYSLCVQDKRYKIVNANHHISRFDEEQVWYLLPVNSH